MRVLGKVDWRGLWIEKGAWLSEECIKLINTIEWVLERQ